MTTGIRVTMAAALVLTLFQVRASANDCDSALTTLEMMQCAEKELATQESKLASLETRIEASLNANQLILLKTTRLAWENFRFSNCASVRSLYDGGTMAPLAFVTCMVAMTEWRIEDLTEVYSPLLDVESTP